MLTIVNDFEMPSDSGWRIAMQHVVLSEVFGEEALVATRPT
jgi:hypothetical protein